MQRSAESKRLAIIDLASRGYLPAQIAGQVGVSRQYVHMVLARLLSGLLRNSPEHLRDLRSSLQ